MLALVAHLHPEQQRGARHDGGSALERSHHLISGLISALRRVAISIDAVGTLHVRRRGYVSGAFSRFRRGVFRENGAA